MIPPNSVVLHIIWENLTLSTWSRTNLEPAEHNRKNPGYKLEFQFHHNQSAHECSPLPESMKVHNLICILQNYSEVRLFGTIKVSMPLNGKSNRGRDFLLINVQ